MSLPKLLETRFELPLSRRHPIRNDSFCQRLLRQEVKYHLAFLPNKKSRGFLLCFFPACTLPQVLCQIQPYCSGFCVVSQVVIATVLARTTASANEQKERTPVWFGVCGVAIT